MTPWLAPLDRLLQSPRTAPVPATAGACAVVLLTGLALFPRSAPQWPTADARVQRFVETLVETGTIATQRMAVYSSTVTAAAKIVEIAPEGWLVSAGDVLFRLDATAFQRTLLEEQAALRHAEAELTRVVEEARLELYRSQEEIDAATQLIANAERSLANETSGKGKLAVIEAEAAVVEAEREFVKAQTDVDDLRPLLKERFVTAAEFETAARTLRRAEDERRLAAARRESVIGFERPAATSKATADVNSARNSFTREGEAALARAAQRRAVIGIARNRLTEIKARIAGLTDQIDRATVRALGPGLVVYRDLFFANERRKPQIGDEVFPNQSLIALPDSSQMIVETRIREIDLHKIQTHQKVRVRVDAYPDLELPATVMLVGALAQEDAGRAGNKFFPVTVTLSAADPRLRTGMTARVEIEVASFPSAVVIPVQALFDDHGQPYVVTIHTGRPERLRVRITAANESLAAIEAGVADGDRLLLVDPTSSPQPR